MNGLLKNLIFLYGPDQGQQTATTLEAILKAQKPLKNTSPKEHFSEKDIAFITYADSFTEQNTKTLRTLQTFLNEQTKDLLNTVHILPYHPDGLDRGFSVVDFYQVKDRFGSWEDIQEITHEHTVMADLVLNHVAVEHEWFQKFLQGDPKYQNYFISFTEDQLTSELDIQLQKVFRPRAVPLLQRYETALGPRYVWSTFSVREASDQIDINYQNPEVLLEMIKVFLFFLQQGIRIIRMDAVGFIWKELGTNCMHLPQSHAILQIFRTILDELCPSALLITETNVPHKDNISYFGNGHDEANMVYNFALPPLVLHAIYTSNATYLTSWAKTLHLLSKDTTFFNFLSSHDGIGIGGARGILPDEAIATMVAESAKHGAKPNFKTLPDGTKTVYELCATWWSIVNQPTDDFELAFRKHITSHAIMLALAGFPAIYYSSLFGKESDETTTIRTLLNRDMVREQVFYPELQKALDNETTKEHKVFVAMKALLTKRQESAAFHPNAKQEILELDPRVFAVLRTSAAETILALHNVSEDIVKVLYRNKAYTLLPYAFLWTTINP